MHDTKERLSLLWSFAFLNYLYADVLAPWAFLAHSIQRTPPPPTMGSDGFSRLDENTHCHDCGVSAAYV
jgi:hypothetical protein